MSFFYGQQPLTSTTCLDQEILIPANGWNNADRVVSVFNKWLYDSVCDDILKPLSMAFEIAHSCIYESVIQKLNAFGAFVANESNMKIVDSPCWFNTTIRSLWKNAYACSRDGQLFGKRVDELLAKFQEHFLLEHSDIIYYNSKTEVIDTKAVNETFLKAKRLYFEKSSEFALPTYSASTKQIFSTVKSYVDEKSIPEDQKIDWVIIPMRYERADEHNEDFRCLITLHTRERMVSGIYITNSLTQPKQKSTLLCSTTDQHGWFENLLVQICTHTDCGLYDVLYMVVPEVNTLHFSTHNYIIACLKRFIEEDKGDVIRWTTNVELGDVMPLVQKNVE